jgi:hypothetical protein
MMVAVTVALKCRKQVVEIDTALGRSCYTIKSMQFNLPNKNCNPRDGYGYGATLLPN